MEEFLQKCADIWHKLAEDPTAQTHALLVAVLLGLTFTSIRRKRPHRTRVWVDAPPGEKVFVQTGEDDQQSKQVSK